MLPETKSCKGLWRMKLAAYGISTSLSCSLSAGLYPTPLHREVPSYCQMNCSLSSLRGVIQGINGDYIRSIARLIIKGGY